MKASQNTGPKNVSTIPRGDGKLLRQA